jgi:hypothetical protein
MLKRSRLEMVGIVAGLVFLTSSLAHAQKDLASEVLSMVRGANAERAKAPKLKQAAKALVKRNENLNKEYRVYDNQLRRRLGPIRRAILADNRIYDADVKRFNRAIAPHHARCRGRLPTAQYNRCMSERRYWDGRRNRLLSRKTRIGSRWRNYKR